MALTPDVRRNQGPVASRDAALPRRRRGYRKKLVATVSRCERVYKRTGEPSVTFCGTRSNEGGAENGAPEKVVGTECRAFLGKRRDDGAVKIPTFGGIQTA